jgi:hypothetical protein
VVDRPPGLKNDDVVEDEERGIILPLVRDEDEEVEE